MDSELMELEEIEEVDDLWNDTDEDTETKRNTNNNSKKPKQQQNVLKGPDVKNKPTAKTRKTSQEKGTNIPDDREMDTMIDEVWNDSDDKTTPAGNDEDHKPKNITQRVEKPPFSPRMEADIDKLIEELDAAIEPNGKSKTRARYVLCKDLIFMCCINTAGCANICINLS
jgi:hypothetical protein